MSVFDDVADRGCWNTQATQVINSISDLPYTGIKGFLLIKSHPTPGNYGKSAELNHSLYWQFGESTPLAMPVEILAKIMT
jgi:hypothetical protein